MHTQVLLVNDGREFLGIASDGQIQKRLDRTGV